MSSTPPTTSAASAPATMEKPQWPAMEPDHPLLQLYNKLPEVLAASDGYDEIWGVKLIPPSGGEKGGKRVSGSSGNGGKKAVVVEGGKEEAEEGKKEEAEEGKKEEAEEGKKGEVEEEKAAEGEVKVAESKEGEVKVAEGKEEMKGEEPAAAEEKLADKTEEVKEAEAPVDTTETPDFATLLILQKFLRANSSNVPAAFLQLQDTMAWRRTFLGSSPLQFSPTKFSTLGYNTLLPTTPHYPTPSSNLVVSWSIYGACSLKSTFSSLPEFLRWRVALMEQCLSLLHLPSATVPIPDYGKGDDPYQVIQIHDYAGVSFLRLPTEVKQASRKTIEMFGRYYPETAKAKFMVNVPAVMGWVWGVLKRVVAGETRRKMEMLGDAGRLGEWLGEGVPKRYGGKAGELEEIGMTVKGTEEEGGKGEPEQEKKEEEEAGLEKVKSEPLVLTQDEKDQPKAPETEEKGEKTKEEVEAKKEADGGATGGEAFLTLAPEEGKKEEVKEEVKEPVAVEGGKKEEVKQDNEAAPVVAEEKKVDEPKTAEAVIAAAPEVAEEKKIEPAIPEVAKSEEKVEEKKDEEAVKPEEKKPEEVKV